MVLSDDYHPDGTFNDHNDSSHEARGDRALRQVTQTFLKRNMFNKGCCLITDLLQHPFFFALLPAPFQLVGSILLYPLRA